jgi:metal-sulfur cluster biosynthetic enzyme
MLTEADLRDALTVCFDPETAINIVDLGLLQSIEVTPDRDAPGTDPRAFVRVTLLSRTADETQQGMLRAQVENRLMGMPQVSRAVVDYMPEPWSEDRIAPAAHQQWQAFRASRQGLVNIRL